MKRFFGYIRVSTVKQGEQGVSLQEQRDAIIRYAHRAGLEISAWFEERETAAKRGRPVFTRMLKLLDSGKAEGVIIHKIDRSARNLKDWADLGELIDRGCEVHFANESLDLHSRGGRLSADIQAVIAADYIRNLKEEVRKGFYGRIKQGLYPLPAPVGYLNTGKGKPKELDPAKAPLVREVFELYASGKYSLRSLVEEVWRLGLRNERGSKLTRNGLSVLLNNPFYIGLIRLRRTGETFPGVHQPLIPKSLFDRVHQILTGKTNTSIQRHGFLFRRFLVCKQCGYRLIGELQKHHIYYRCHTKICSTTTIREEVVESALLDQLFLLQLNDEEKAYLQQKLAQLHADWAEQHQAQETALSLHLSQLQDRLNRLTDAYIDRVIEKELFENRKTMLLLEMKDLEERLTEYNRNPASPMHRLSEFLELAGSVYLQYKMALPGEKRDLVKIVTSNRLIERKNVVIALHFPFQEVANRFKNTNGAPHRDIPRTWDAILPKLLAHFAEQKAQE